MKLRFSMIGLFILVISNIASARILNGVKEGGGDDSIIFVCKSSTHTDSDLQILGLGSSSNDIQLHIFTQGQLVALDAGVIDTHTDRYIGQSFDIHIATSGSITAKAPNNAFVVGVSDSLVCGWNP
ncbi:hypothetical protein [Bdellovibrio sp. BCCA]|uniref:hypothetical protein n=1 Tax=Bdellovibrio sp. BCCA TaxID=3136281 RepID=UPI0030F13CC5